MQTREERNADASLRSMPLAVPLATERNRGKRGCRGICSLAKWLRSQAWPFYYVIETWSSVFASQQYSLPMSQLGQSRHFGRRPTTSGLPAGADIATAGRHVSKGPIELKKSFFADD